MGTFVNEFVHGLQNGSSGTLLPIQAVGLNYQKCTTAAETAEKAVSALTGFKLLEGATVVVAFTNSNTANNPTLKVGTTSAKAIYYRGTAIPAGYLAAGRVYQFTYDGNYWQFLGDINTDSSVQQNAATTTNVNYPILLGYDSSTTAVTGSVNKTSNLLYNPSTQLLSTPKLTVNNTTTLNGSTTADSITAGDLLVNGGANFVNIPTAPTAADGTNNNQLATTEFVYNAFRVNDALVFKGIVNSNSDLPATHKQGWVYKVGTSGTYAGETCEIGDTIYCITDGTTATNAHWAIIQNNIDTFPWSRLSGVPSTFNPSAHAVTNSATYGAATTSLYGHVKLVSGNLNGQTYTDGLAAASSHTHSQYLTSHQTMYYRPIKLNSTEVLSSTSSTALTISGGAGLTLTSASGGVITFALASHAVDATTYGAGTSALYGHVKLATGDISSQTYTAGIAAAAAHNHGTIPLVSGGTGISEVTGETWYTSNILHPHFEIFMDDGFACMYKGPLDGITSITDFLTSSYFKMAARVTVPVYANGILLFTGTIMTNAINNNPLYTYILFPDAVPYSGMIVNGVHGILTYSDGDGVYLTDVWPNQPYYVTAGLSSMLGDSAIGDTGTPVYYNGSSLAIVSKVNSASVADTATSASYATTASSASFATSATTATSASYATNAGSAAGLSATIANNRLPTRLQASSSTSVTAAGATEQGWHYIGGNDANKPLFKQVDGLTGNDFRIMTTAYGSTWLQQIATDFRSNDIFTRRNQNGTWQPWTALVKMPQGAAAADLCPANNNCIAIFDNSRNATIKATSATLSVDGNLSTPGTITASGGFVGTATSASYATTAGAFNSVASVSLTGDVSGSASSVKGWAITTTIGDSKVTSAKIADNAVVTAKINNGAVTSAKLGDSSVVTAKINDSAVTSAKLANSGVTANTYGNTSQQTPTSGNTFNIPYFTVSAKGIVTSAGVTTVKLPNSIASATTATSASYATNAGSAASATVATSANSVAWANVSGHAAGVKSDLGIESSGSTYLKKDGTWDTPTDTNDAVTQTATTTDASYEVLFSGTADNTTRTEGAGKNSNLTFNPSTGVLTVTGNLYLKNPGGTSDWTNPEKLVLVGASNKEFSFKVNNNGNNVDVGWDWDTGAGSGLGLRGSGYTSPGQFFLYARNSTTGYAGLAGDANGVLKWNNRRVVTATDATQIGSASQPVYINSAGNATAGNTIPTITLNGSATTAASLYAPTSAGTSGQLLKSSGSGAPTWATITASDVGAATADHSHTLSIASTTETANIVLSAGGFYKLTAGDQTYNFQLPADNDTKNTAGATEVAANTTMWIVGATGQTANPQTYTKTGAKIDADGGLLGKTITVDTHVTLTYDSTTQSLKFVFS